ncbi:secretion system protein E [Candidatus Saccharibacteria bacterium RIFCSPHIGHO2_12_FULL_41_12]|nr:MAG: secretion system protein E [Candidatus Saccharibacteria bacterium RIFCSPHIGHO2_12_FULL_41_12]
MKINDEQIEKLLLDAGIIGKEALGNIKAQADTEKLGLQDIVVKNNIISEKDLTKMYSETIDAHFIDLNPKEIKREILKLIPEKFAKQYKVVLFGVEEDGSKLIAMEDPDDVQAINFLQKQIGTNLKMFVAPTSSILQALDQYRDNVSSELTKVLAPDQEEAEDDEDLSEEDLAEDSPIAQTVNLIIEYAIKSSASDIHIEPRETYVSVRYRVDGILKEANKLPKKVHGPLVSRIKILSNLKIDERRAPQDGRFKIQIGSGFYALRVSTLPISEGEKVVMRILNESSKALTLEELGYWGKSLDTINKAIIQPHGMILVTGPTGSGKSTSLFSTLSLLNKPSVNISTVEDPVEYKIPGANQTQVNPKAGMTFASGLRALLRQDPNIIMVGEIRDGETAGLGVQAALTGHLVFATLHTNNAATCLPRLLDMGIEPFLIASTVRAVVGQRLVRRLCVDCRSPEKPDATTTKKIYETFRVVDKTKMKYIHELEKAALDGGIGKSNGKSGHSETDSLSTTEDTIMKIWKAKDDGCEACGHTGYKGRIGIYEVLDNSSDVQKLIVGNGTSDAIQNQAVAGGMVIMQIDGFIKALRGQTSIEEILRVTSER